MLAVGDAVRDLREAYTRTPAAADGGSVVNSALAEARRWLASDDLVEQLDLDQVLSERVLHMLLPGNRAHHRNPAGSVERQAERTLVLLARAEA